MLGSESVGYYLGVGGKVKAVRSKTTKQATKQPNKQRSSPKSKEGDMKTGNLGGALSARHNRGGTSMRPKLPTKAKHGAF